MVGIDGNVQHSKGVDFVLPETGIRPRSFSKGNGPTASTFDATHAKRRLSNISVGSTFLGPKDPLDEFSDGGNKVSLSQFETLVPNFVSKHIREYVEERYNEARSNSTSGELSVAQPEIDFETLFDPGQGAVKKDPNEIQKLEERIQSMKPLLS
jgi:hypothetical protein